MPFGNFLKSFVKAFNDIIHSVSSGIREGFCRRFCDDGQIPIKPIGENIGGEVGEESPDIIREVIGEFILVAMKFI